MDEDLVSFRWSRGRDPDGSKLRAVFEAQRAWEAARARRTLLVHVLALVSVLSFLSAALPHAVEGLRRMAVTLWALAAVVLARAAVSEWRWKRRRDACASAAELGDERG